MSAREKFRLGSSTRLSGLVVAVTGVLEVPAPPWPLLLLLVLPSSGQLLMLKSFCRSCIAAIMPGHDDGDDDDGDVVEGGVR
jgi:hypothetical protein